MFIRMERCNSPTVRFMTSIPWTLVVAWFKVWLFRLNTDTFLDCTGGYCRLLVRLWDGSHNSNPRRLSCCGPAGQRMLFHSMLTLFGIALVAIISASTLNVKLLASRGIVGLKPTHCCQRDGEAAFYAESPAVTPRHFTRQLWSLCR
ncbi:hypothetical protein C8Q78DRAFT_312750 [Trametes maxima]|nr:hypothetical protein C8Q78DRAFT_312750 [Trametes maxima]